MSSSWTCRTCVRALRSHRNGIASTSKRHFSSAVRLAAKPAASTATATTTEDASAKHEAYVPDVVNSKLVQAAEGIAKRAPKMTESYVAYGVTDMLMRECIAKADYDIPQARERDGEIPKDAEGEDIGVGKGGWWLDELKLQPSFSTWTHVSFLHMYLITTRLRLLDADVTRQWQQHFLDHFFVIAETRMMSLHNIHMSSLRQRYLKDLFSQWRGVLLSYDEGMIKGDAVLAAAVWRNLFKGRDNVDVQMLAQIVSWMRRDLRRLDQAPNEEIGTGLWTFGQPADEKAGVLVQSKLMKENERA